MSINLKEEEFQNPIALSDSYSAKEIILQTLITSIDDPFLVIDSNGIIEHCSSGKNSIIFDSLQARNINELKNFDNLYTEIFSIYEKISESKKNIIIEYNQSETSEFYLITATFLNYNIHNLNFILVKVKDFSSEKKYEKSLQSAFLFYEKQSYALNSAASISITDKSGNIIFVNENFCKLSGYTSQELLGKNHNILNSHTHSRAFFADLWRTILKGNSWKGEIQNRDKNGSLYWIETTIVPIKNENDEIIQFIAIRYDITEKKKNESLMIHTANMASLGEMAGGLAHEINNPLTIILGKIYHIERKIECTDFDKDKIKENFNIIDKSLARIAKIVSEFLKFAKHSDYEAMQCIPIAQIIESALYFCREKFRTNGIEIYLDNICQSAIYCKPIKISQVILNLLNNSYEAIANLPDKWIEISILENSPDVISIAVTDSGLGINENILPHMFKPFYSKKETTPGLGLSIAKGIIEEHKGTIHYDLNSENTRFIVTLARFKS
ncbi:PAS domain-containing sensor histidine kinase [Fluviispira vulneris]|uniref:PAS domain-containing sensor histidine kinase n=1 Tax=Fluviispira vulneris TaxID=2763012 RepID=UPI0016475DDB|nr:PAS domain S-box protein [Fluviispira vulneris]